MNPRELLYPMVPAAASLAIVRLLLSRFPIMYGIDGPYYLIQMKHLLADGFIKYPDPPLTYYLLIPFYAASPDPNLGIKIGVAFYAAVTSLILYLVFYKVSRSVASGLLASLLYITSPFTLRLSMDFIKNFIGILFIALFLYSALCVKRRRLSITLSILATLLSSLSHVLDFGILGLLAALLIISWLIRRDWESRVLAMSSIAALLTSLIILLLALVVVPQVLGYDAMKLVEFLKNPFSGKGTPPMVQGFLIPVLIIAGGGIAYSITKNSRSRLFTHLAFASSILLLFTNAPVGSSWFFRFTLMNSILLPILPAILIAELGDTKTKILAFTLILGLSVSLTIPTLAALRPSVSMEGYREIQSIPKYIPAGSTLLVPETPLRYWIEALHEENYKILNKPQFPPPENAYLITRVNRLRHPPPHAEPIFEGNFIQIYCVK